MKQTSRIKHSSRRHRLLAALSACGFAACLVSSQYAQAAPQATELQVEEGEVPTIATVSLLVGFVGGAVFGYLYHKYYGKSNAPVDLISGLPEKAQPVLLKIPAKAIFVSLGTKTPTSGELSPTKALSTRDSHRILN